MITNPFPKDFREVMTLAEAGHRLYELTFGVPEPLSSWRENVILSCSTLNIPPEQFEDKLFVQCSFIFKNCTIIKEPIL